jgi:predicted TIM-barrel fold metal-dependent hydrolase
MHHFRASDPSAYVVYEEASSENIPVFIHFGELKIPIYNKLGLEDNIDLQFSDPGDLSPAACEFRDVNFIIPHFGCGKFDQALTLAAENENVFLDTASSNSWIKPPLTLETVFRRTLDVVGPGRILFGTDSSVFPRGWRRDIFEKQYALVEKMNLSGKEKAQLFGGNVKRLLKRN